jgi:hypothetical protein
MMIFEQKNFTDDFLIKKMIEWKETEKNTKHEVYNQRRQIPLKYRKNQQKFYVQYTIQVTVKTC